MVNIWWGIKDDCCIDDNIIKDKTGPPNEYGRCKTCHRIFELRTRRYG